MLARKGKILVWGVAIFFGGLVAGPIWAAEKGAAVGSAEARILAALDDTTTIEFIEEPLTSAVDFLKDYHDIPIQIDEPALEENGLATDESVSKSLAGISLRSALNLFLHDLGLDWTIANEVLLITTPKVAEKIMFTRVYDVGDLILARDGDGKLWRDFDSLIDVLTSTIEPETWEDVGGPGRIASFEIRGAAGLVIRHTPKVHHQIGLVLRDMSELAEKQGDEEYPTRERSAPVPRCEVSGVMGSGMEPAAATKSAGTMGGAAKSK